MTTPSSTTSTKTRTSDVQACQIKELTRALYAAQQERNVRDAMIEDLTADKKELLTRFRNAASRNSSRKSRQRSLNASPADAVDEIMTDLTNRYKAYASSMKGGE